MKARNCTKNITRLLLTIIFLTLVSLIIARCFYGLGLEFSDEFSQPATVKRFLHGDRLLIDDWQPATTLIGYLLYCIAIPFKTMHLKIIQLRIIYVLYQVVITGLLFFLLGKRQLESGICAFTYLASTPYGIMSICYNTVAIASFMLFLVLVCSEYAIWKRVLAGVTLAISVLANPYNIITFFIYCIITVVSWLAKKEARCFEIYGFKWLFVGIAVLFVPFCLLILTSGTVDEYYLNLKFIFGDVEHNEYGLLTKLVRCLFQLIRIYWRAWMPLLLIIVAAFLLRKKQKSRKYLYALTCLVAIYATFRFAFIYGSVSINLMVVPFFFWGLSTVVLMIIWRIELAEYYYEMIWLAFGFLFAVCNYLATNTEMLSMSAMFIVADIAVIVLNIRVIIAEFPQLKVLPIFASWFLVVCLMIQRILFVWGDAEISEYDTQIESGIAKGIYTTYDNATNYYNIQAVISEADLSNEDKVLIVPCNPLYYMWADCEFATPYVFRFETKVNELNDYYKIHDYKWPTKVIIFDRDDNTDMVDYFKDNGYDFMKQENDYCIMYNRSM